ncbi:MAG: 2-amino-4-hydroxy-6-hydroxymethyldihydropteridine diphosphokinase [Acidobacteria bacterium]|nr:2-amino-4-hydroxy-6-hydroxymethyldihydropteridine diphosphokinase [Acidobacteriota bacterium]
MIDQSERHPGNPAPHPEKSALRSAKVTAWIALGSNVGDRRGHLEWAIDALQTMLDNLRTSSIRETAPVGVPDPQPDYLNAVVAGETTLPVFELHRRLQGLERQRGRQRRSYRGARTLDLDLLFYGDERIDTPDLVVPHPRLRERRFVLEPMAELDPAWVDPVTGRTVSVLLDDLAVQRNGA